LQGPRQREYQHQKSNRSRVVSGSAPGLLRGGIFPIAFVYPSIPARYGVIYIGDECTWRMGARGDRGAHSTLTNYQYNLPPFEKRLQPLIEALLRIDTCVQPCLQHEFK
jgi:hypothetical protein